MFSISQIPIRLGLSATSSPPNAPIDNNTGKTPAAWRSQDLSIQIGIFDIDGNAVDLSNLSYLQIILSKLPTSLYPLAVVTVLQEDIVDSIDRAGWLQGIEQQATAIFSAAMMDQGLDAMQAASFWISIQGVTTGGQFLTYGAGEFVIYNPGIGQVTALGSPSTHSQVLTSGNATVNPSSQIHTEVITFNGGAGTYNLFAGNTGIKAGALLDLLLFFPATAALIINICDGVGEDATILYTITTTVVGLQGLYRIYYTGTDWAMKEAIFPSY